MNHDHEVNLGKMSTEVNEDVHEEFCEISSSVPTKQAKEKTFNVWKKILKLPRATSNERLKAQCNVCKKIFLADSIHETSKLKRHISTHLVKTQKHRAEPIDQKIDREKVYVEKELTKQERNQILKTQKVLSGRIFDPEIISKPGMCYLADVVELQSWTHLFVDHVPVLHEAQVRDFYYNASFTEDGSLNTQVGNIIFHLNEEILGEILGVPREGIRSVVGQSCSNRFVQQCGKLLKLSRTGIPKKFLKGEYHLYFEFVNKVLLPRSEKQNVASAADLYIMESLSNFDDINLPAIMLEHMHKTVSLKDGNHSMGYGYFLTKVFNHIEIPLGAGVNGTMKQTISMNTLVKCGCVEGLTGQMNKVSELLVEQDQLKHKLEEMTALLSKKDADIARLKAQLVKA